MKKNLSRKGKTALKAACLAAGLCVASWTGGAATAKASLDYTYEISGSISPDTNLSNVYLFYGINDSGPPSEVFFKAIGNIAADETKSFSDVFTVTYPQLEDAYDRHFTIIGTYDQGGDGVVDGVTVGMAEGYDGVSWESLFHEVWSHIYDPSYEEVDFTEQMVMGWLEDGNIENLTYFVEDAIFSPYHSATASSFGGSPVGEDGYPATLYNFSDATQAGTADADMHDVSSVPLPSALLLFASGFGGLLTRRFFGKK